MQKLTKEQEKWLLSKIKYSFEEYSKYCRNPNFEELEKIINQCTEKEFPVLLVSINDERDGELASLSIKPCKPCGDDYFRLCFMDFSKMEDFEVDVGIKQLREINIGVNKILDYYDEKI